MFVINKSYTQEEHDAHRKEFDDAQHASIDKNKFNVVNPPIYIPLGPRQTVIANVCYNQQIILQAAERVRQRPKWTNNQAVQNLKLTPHWIQNAIWRQTFKRRKITRTAPKYGTDDHVNSEMKIGQEMIVVNGNTAREVGNFDDTALTYAIEPSKKYCIYLHVNYI